VLSGIPDVECRRIQVLAKRNHIAHGSELDVGVEDYLFLHDEFTSLMNLLRNQIENAAVDRQYLNKPEKP
jgi:hypothetical protein